MKKQIPSETYGDMRKKFGGHLYNYEATYYTKKKADRLASALRKEGMPAEISKGDKRFSNQFGTRWQVWGLRNAKLLSRTTNVRIPKPRILKHQKPKTPRLGPMRKIKAGGRTGYTRKRR